MNDVATPQLLIEPPKHGGDISAFCQAHGFSEDEVLDLSTGISPWSWSVPDVPQRVWQSLPYADSNSGLIAAAANYYQCSMEHLLPVAGSQAAIEMLPKIAAPNSQVLIPELGYAEHAYRWQQAGHVVNRYAQLDALEEQIKQGDAKYAVVINPNNPSAEQYSPEQLLPLARMLEERSGFLIVDEAFVDVVADEISLAPYVDENSLVVLRSVGKFFGLAGLRLGFAIASESLINRLAIQNGLWSVSSAAQWVGANMLADWQWIAEQKRRLKLEATGFADWLEKHIPGLDWKQSTTFVSGYGGEQEIVELEAGLAQAGILVRTFYALASTTDSSMVRLGLVEQSDLQRLQLALNQLGINQLGINQLEINKMGNMEKNNDK